MQLVPKFCKLKMEKIIYLTDNKYKKQNQFINVLWNCGLILIFKCICYFFNNTLQD